MPYKGTLAFKAGDRVGRLTLLNFRRIGEGRARMVVWVCRCDCGKRAIVRNSNLSAGTTNSCGCLRAELLKKKQVYKPGQKVGRWTLLQRLAIKKNGNWASLWKAKCDCGTRKTIRQTNFTNGQSRSCGCFHRQRVSETQTIHGESDKTTEWVIWMNMIQRCENKNSRQYKDYGGRGIRIYRGWRSSYKAFLMDVGRRPSQEHSLNRVRNEEGYYPGNVNWATSKEQNSNKRSNVVIEWDGVRKTVTQWAEALKINAHTIFGRLNRGWDHESALRPIYKKTKTIE